DRLEGDQPRLGPILEGLEEVWPLGPGQPAVVEADQPAGARRGLDHLAVLAAAAATLRALHRRPTGLPAEEVGGADLALGATGRLTGPLDANHACASC